MSNEETKNEDAQDVDAKGTPRVIVYVGLRLDQKDVAYHMYAVLSDEEVTLGTWRHIDPMCNGRKVLAFRKPLGKYIGIGKAIHAIEFPDNKWRVSYYCETCAPRLAKSDTYEWRVGKRLANDAIIMAFSHVVKYEGRVPMRIILAWDPTNHATPFITWTVNSDTGDTFWGHYFEEIGQAHDDYISRVINL